MSDYPVILNLLNLSNMFLRKISNTVALVTGIFFLIQEVWLFMNPLSFETANAGMFAIMLNLIAGIGGIYLGGKGNSRLYNIIIGLVLLLTGGLWFINGGAGMLAGLLNINGLVAAMNISIGAPCFFIGVITPKRNHSYNIVLLY